MSGELAQTFHEHFGVSTAQPGLLQLRQQIECKRMPFCSWVATGSNGLLKSFAAQRQMTLAVLLDQRQANQIRAIGHI